MKNLSSYKTSFQKFTFPYSLTRTELVFILRWFKLNLLTHKLELSTIKTGNNYNNYKQLSKLYILSSYVTTRCYK